MNKVIRCLAGLLWVSSAGVLLAQTSAARLQGTVKDASGAVVPRAKITLQLIATGASWPSESNAAGAMTTVTVAGDVTPMVTDTGPTLSNIVERERIEQLPIDGRQFYNLMVLTTPGLEEGASGPQRPEPFGLRGGIVDVQQDGASLQNDNTGMITWAPPGLDTVQQYNVEMSVSSARYEKPITGVLSTRSGTNQWQGDFRELTGSGGNSLTLYDPSSTAGAAQNYSRTPFPGNQLPIGRLSPLAKYAYSVLPLPTLPTANPATTSNWFGSNPSQTTNTTYTVRIDHRFSDRDQVFGRYSIGRYNLLRKYNAGTNVPTLDDLWNFETAAETLQTPMATWNHTFSPRFFVETMGVWSPSCPAPRLPTMTL
jgi:hypothetical protein